MDLTQKISKKEMRKLVPDFWRTFFSSLAFTSMGLFFVKDNYLHVVIFATLIVFFVLVLFEAHTKSSKKTIDKITEMNEHIISLEFLIYREVFRTIDMANCERFFSHLVSCHLSGIPDHLPKNLPAMICDSKDCYLAFRKEVVKNLERLTMLQKEEWGRSCNHQEMNRLILERRNLENLLLEIDKEAGLHNFIPMAFVSNLDGSEGRMVGITADAS